MMFNFNPQTLKKLRRFREIRRGYYSFVILAVLLVVLALGELLVNSRALIVKYEGEWFFPTYTAFHPGTDFGLDYSYEANYRELREKFAAEGGDNWVLMPLVPYNPYENNAVDGVFRPAAPSLADQHYLGTDTTSRDILARRWLAEEKSTLHELAAEYGISAERIRQLARQEAEDYRKSNKGSRIMQIPEEPSLTQQSL